MQTALPSVLLRLSNNLQLTLLQTLFAQSQRALCTKYAAPLVGPSGSKSGRHEHILFHTRSSSQYNINYNEHVSQVAPINPAISSREAAQPRPGNNIRHGGTSIHGTQAQLQVLPRGRQKTSSSHKNASPHATVYPLAFRSSEYWISIWKTYLFSLIPIPRISSHSNKRQVQLKTRYLL